MGGSGGEGKWVGQEVDVEEVGGRGEERGFGRSEGERERVKGKRGVMRGLGKGTAEREGKKEE